MNPPSATLPVSPDSRWGKFLRQLFRLVLVLLITALLALALTAHLLPRFAAGGDQPRGLLVAAGGLLLAVPAALMYFTRRVRSWWWIVAGYLAVAPVLVYLAADDPVVRRPMTVEEIAPAFPGAELSYARLMHYAKGRPAAVDFQEPGLEKEWPGAGADYLAFVREHRTRLEADWEGLAPIRAWYDELNAFERIGDLGEARAWTEIPVYHVHRAMFRHGRAQATLLALDGRGDDAIETLLPLLGVGRKMQVHARTLVRAMIGQVVRQQALHAVEFTLDHAEVSPDVRRRLAAELAAGGGGEAGIRRMIAIEYAFLAAHIPDPAWGGYFTRDTWWGWVVNPFAHFLLNQRRTINLLGELAVEVEELAASRQTGRIDGVVGRFFAERGRPAFKNIFGAILIANGYPSYERVAETYWKMEDHRAALLARLR